MTLEKEWVIMSSPKRTSFKRTLFNNSEAGELSEAAKEWKITKIGHSEYYSQCECCGTPIKNHAIIENDITEATLIIGLNCLENLRCTQEGLELPSFKGYIRNSQTVLEGKIKQFYEGTPVDIKSWKNWFLHWFWGLDVPDDMKEGIAQLKLWGILSDEFMDRFIEYHDDNRLFPREVLIPVYSIFYWKRLLKNLISLNIPAYITINQRNPFLWLNFDGIDEDKAVHIFQALKLLTEQIELVDSYTSARLQFMDMVCKKMEESHYSLTNDMALLRLDLQELSNLKNCTDKKISEIAEKFPAYPLLKSIDEYEEVVGESLYLSECFKKIPFDIESSETIDKILKIRPRNRTQLLRCCL
jgi:hypothetical protein